MFHNLCCQQTVILFYSIPAPETVSGMTTKRKRAKTPSEYPWISFRPSPFLMARLETLAETTRQPISVIVREALTSSLPAMESAAAAAQEGGR